MGFEHKLKCHLLRALSENAHQPLLYWAFYCCLETLGLLSYFLRFLLHLLLLLPHKIGGNTNSSLLQKGRRQGFKNSLNAAAANARPQASVAASTAVTMQKDDDAGWLYVWVPPGQPLYSAAHYRNGTFPVPLKNAACPMPFFPAFFL